MIDAIERTVKEIGLPSAFHAAALDQAYDEIRYQKSCILWHVENGDVPSSDLDTWDEKIVGEAVERLRLLASKIHEATRKEDHE